MHCETTDDENETEKTLLIKKHETPVDLNYYQNNVNCSNPGVTNNNQNSKNYTPHIIEKNYNLKSIYQNTTNRIQAPNEIKIDNFTPYRKSKK